MMGDAHFTSKGEQFRHLLKKDVSPFVAKLSLLMKRLTEEQNGNNEDYVADWNEEGDQVYIKNMKKFEDYLVEDSVSRTFGAFRKQLNKYQFKVKEELVKKQMNEKKESRIVSKHVKFFHSKKLFHRESTLDQLKEIKPKEETSGGVCRRLRARDDKDVEKSDKKEFSANKPDLHKIVLETFEEVKHIKKMVKFLIDSQSSMNDVSNSKLHPIDWILEGMDDDMSMMSLVDHCSDTSQPHEPPEPTLTAKTATNTYKYGAKDISTIVDPPNYDKQDEQDNVTKGDNASKNEKELNGTTRKRKVQESAHDPKKAEKKSGEKPKSGISKSHVSESAQNLYLGQHSKFSPAIRPPLSFNRNLSFPLSQWEARNKLAANQEQLPLPCFCEWCCHHTPFHRWADDNEDDIDGGDEDDENGDEDFKDDVIQDLFGTLQYDPMSSFQSALSFHSMAECPKPATTKKAFVGLQEQCFDPDLTISSSSTSSLRMPKLRQQKVMKKQQKQFVHTSLQKHNNHYHHHHHNHTLLSPLSKSPNKNGRLGGEETNGFVKRFASQFGRKCIRSFVAIGGSSFHTRIGIATVKFTHLGFLHGCNRLQTIYS